MFMRSFFFTVIRLLFLRKAFYNHAFYFIKFPYYLTRLFNYYLTQSLLTRLLLQQDADP